MAAPGFRGTASTVPVGRRPAAERLTRQDALNPLVDVWDIYLTDEVAIWLEELQASDRRRGR